MDTNEIIKNIGEKYNLDSIGIFGSRARGDFREDSDYDIFIIGDISLEDELKLEENLAVALNIDVDIIKLDKHPIYYLVSFLDKIYNKYKNCID